MMRDRFDKLLLLAMLATVAFLAMVLLQGGSAASGAATGSALERELAYRAKVELLERIYRPVTELHGQGREQQALLKLAELEKRFPGEAHGYLLKAEILWQLQAFDEAIASMVEAVRRNGDYLDEHSPLSRRSKVEQMVDAGQQRLARRLRDQPENGAARAALTAVHYLQSRLAGGCE